MNVKISFIVSGVLLGSAIGMAHEIEQVVVTAQQEKANHLKDTIEKTEVITKQAMDHTQAMTLIEAIEKSPGVSVTTNCSVCGIKRVMLNGLKGEHTTVLQDGVPFHSTVSSYYGLDGVTLGDVESIEIARGSGASLSAPEAIGGTINIVSRRAKKNGAEFDFAVGNQGYKSGSFVGEGISADKKTGVLISGRYSNMDQYDGDKNGVSESPKLENQSFSIKAFHQLSDRTLLDVKLTHGVSRVFGAPMVGKSQAMGSLSGVVGNSGLGYSDVRSSYDVAYALAITEKIDTTRDEMIAKVIHTLTPSMSLQTTLAYAVAHQTSLYEGDTYNNNDKTFFGDVKLNHALNDDHFFTYGVDLKNEKMRSASTFFTTSADSDAFDYRSLGLYVQDRWAVTPKTEIAMALRGVKVTTNWLGQTTKNNEVDETLVLPRVHIRHDHSASLTSRLSAGMGYRAPLTFFESEHGLVDNGFSVEVNKLEKSKNGNYSLSFVHGPLSVTGGIGRTQVENLAYVDDSNPTLVLRNSSDTVSVTNGDILVGYALTPSLSVSGGYETYRYDAAYKNHLAIAAVEQRAKMLVDWESNGWDVMAQATWTGARNLEPYGYSEHYDDASATSLKSSKAPSFTTVDLKVAKEIDHTWEVYSGVKNLFDYVQVKKDSPQFFDANGGFDSAHIWGPLRGRMIYAGIKAKF